MDMIKKAAGKNDMSKRILVVDDQPDNRQIIRDMLAPTDYEITEAENGELALAAVAKQRPDLILMDIQLPIMDGYTATSRIKSDPKLRSIPIIAVTSYVLSGEEKKARAAGCDDYVPKPFSPRQLLAKISNTSPKPGSFAVERHMRRRQFIKLLGGAAAWPLAARAQQPESMRRIGVLMGFPESDSQAQSFIAAFRDGLQKVGWTDGRNVRIDTRWPGFDAESRQRFAKELVALQPDLILSHTTPTTAALLQETRTIPIVFAT